jgi:putative FmdB family regulatory protein
MPLYEYQCDACGRIFEIIQKFSDPLVEKCPSCGRGPVRKLFSSPAIQFKGSGWYITDYAKKDQKASKSEGSSPDSGGQTDEKKDEKKDAKRDEKKSETKKDGDETSSASTADTKPSSGS